jgi:transposase
MYSYRHLVIEGDAMARKLLRDDQYKSITGMLPAQPGDPGRKSDNRLFLEAVLWIARSGAPWRDLPPEFGEWNTVYQRFGRWSKKGVWHKVFAELAKDADFEEAFIDSTIIKAHQHAAGAVAEPRHHR